MQTTTLIRFSTGGVVRAPPPPRVKPKPFGDYCWRATCSVEDDVHQKVGAFMGYDAVITITEVVEKECTRHCKIHGGTCLTPELVLLPSSRKECSGQVFYFTLDGKSRKIF